MRAYERNTNDAVWTSTPVFQFYGFLWVVAPVNHNFDRIPIQIHVGGALPAMNTDGNATKSQF